MNFKKMVTSHFQNIGTIKKEKYSEKKKKKIKKILGITFSSPLNEITKKHFALFVSEVQSLL